VNYPILRLLLLLCLATMDNHQLADVVSSVLFCQLDYVTHCRLSAVCKGLYKCSREQRAWYKLVICRSRGWPKCVEKVPHMRFLDLNRCWNSINDATFACIVRLPFLTTLNLRYCYLLTDVSLLRLLGNVLLQSLNLRECSAITDDGLSSLARLPALTTLNVRGCNLITDTGLAAIARLPSLTTLNLRDCNQITDAGLVHLMGNMLLQSLDLRGCINISGVGLASIARLPSLTTLNFWGCDRITNVDIQQLPASLRCDWVDLID
jgi:hypothetical protein